MSCLVSAKHADDLEEHRYVPLTTYLDVELIASFRSLRMLRHSRIDSDSKQEALNVACEPLTAAGVIHIRVMSDPMREGHRAIRCPEMAQEARNAKSRLLKDLFRHTLFPRPQTEDAELFQPDADGVSHAVSQMAGRRRVKLDLVSLLANPWANLIAEDFDRQTQDLISQQRI